MTKDNFREKISVIDKADSGFTRFKGNIVKGIGHCFHAFFPKRRFALPAYDPPCREALSLSQIPRKIWQTNFSNQCTLPLILNYKHNRALSKGFEYHYVSTEEREKYLLTHAPMRVASAYKRLTDGAAQADLWRLVVLYNEGGIYMDIDATLAHDLESIISGKNQVFISNYNEFTNFFLATSPQNPIFNDFIWMVVGNIENYESGSVYDTTGPGALKKVLDEHKIFDFIPHQLVGVQGAFTNEYFQYMDKPRSKWTYEKTFIR